MIYAKDITTPKNTPASAPVITPLILTRGLIYKVEVEFPPGPSGYLHCFMLHGSHQFCPIPDGETFRSDSAVIDFEDTYPMQTEPFRINIHTYNLDDTYDHWLQVRIGVVSKEVFMARYLPTYSYREFRKVLATEAAVAAGEKRKVLENPLSWLRS